MLDSSVVKGILIGASLGVFAVLLGLHESMFRAVGFGMIAGALAGYTFMKRKNRK